MGSLIELSIKRGHTVSLFYDPASVSGEKAYQRVTEKKLAVFKAVNANLIEFQLKEFGELGKRYALDVMVLPEGYHMLRAQLEDIARLQASGTYMISLNHFFEIAGNPVEALDYFDKTYYTSQFALDTHFSLAKNDSMTAEQLKRKYASKYEIASSPMFDQLIGLDPKHFREEFSVPEGKKVVLLFAPVLAPVTPWRYYVWHDTNRLKKVLRILQNRKWRYFFEALGAQSFKDIVLEIRRFCDENDAYLIVKSRAKQQDPDYLAGIADLYISGYGDIYFPVFTSYKLLSVADLCIAVMSMAVVEAVAAHVPVINIYVPHLDYQARANPLYPDKRNYLDAVMRIDREGPFNFPGCVTTIDRRKFLKWLPKKTLQDFVLDKTALNQYLDSFLGISKEPSSERILNSLGKMSAGR